MEEKKIAKLKTIVLTADVSNLALSSEDTGEFEFIAPEDMKIVGAVLTREAATNCGVWATVSRSGNSHWAGEYTNGNILVTDDQPLFAFRMDTPSTFGFTNPGVKTDFQMLPSPHYFDLEEGERIYVQYKRKNNDTSSHAVVVQVILYYY